MRPIRTTLLLILITLLSALFFWYNLESNEVYYFQQSEKTNKKGLPFVLVDHLEWYIQYTEQVDNYFYDTEGINSIFYSNDNETYILEQDNGYTTSYELMVGTDSEKNISYGFDDNYELRSKMMFSDATDLEELPLSSKDKTIIKYGLEKTSKQLLKQLPSPIINLQ